MFDLIRCRGRGSRFLALTLGAVTMFALVLVATPAFAIPTAAESFNPDEIPGGAGVMVLSDQADGTNSTFHVTAVATPDTSNVAWWHCPISFSTVVVNDTAVTNPTHPDPAVNNTSNCLSAGTDSTGVQPTSSSGTPIATPPSDEVYETDFNVPDDVKHDWVTLYCDGPANVSTNCKMDVENDVQFDDAGNGSVAPGGEITSPKNAANVSNVGFTPTATTSTDVSEVTFCLMGADAATDPAGGCAVTAVDTAPDNQASDWAAQGKQWSSPANMVPPATTELALILLESMGGGAAGYTPNCTGNAADCQLDSHYIVSQAAFAGGVSIAFPDERADPAATLPRLCGGPGAQSSADSAPNEYVRVHGCRVDQSGNLIALGGHWAFQISPIDSAGTSTDETGFECYTGGPTPRGCSDPTVPTAAVDEHGNAFGNFDCDNRAGAFVGWGTATGCPSGPALGEAQQNDINNDKFYEMVDGDPGQEVGSVGNVAEEVLDFHTGGTYTVGFCLDTTNNAEDLFPSQSPTPCDDETAANKTTGTITVTPGVDHVHLKKQGQTDALCHTGSSTSTAPAGSAVALTGCTLSTRTGGTEQPAGNVHVLWIVNPTNNPGDPGQITTQQNLSDAQGQAAANISSGSGAAEKTTTIRFCVDDFPTAGVGNGICDNLDFNGPFIGNFGFSADYQINWTQAPGPGPGPGGQTCPTGFNGIRGTNQNDLLIGTAGCDSIKGRAGSDSLRGKAGDDRLSGGSPSRRAVRRLGVRPDRGNGGTGVDRCRGIERQRKCES